MKLSLFFVFVLFTLSSGSAQLVSEASVNLVGVQEIDGVQVGSIAELSVEVHNGSGRVFLDTMPLTQIDTQTSARLASQVACATLEIDCSMYDFFYVIRSGSPLIGGPSAGGSMALATVLALTDSVKDGSIAMTGTINPDGTVGSVGGIFAKAEAVSQAGFKVFLVPPTQSIVGSLSGDINLSEYAFDSWGLRVVEVSNLDEVFEQFTGFKIVREDFSENIVSSDYDDLINVMSSSLFKRFSELENSTREKFSSANLSASVRDEVSFILNSSSSALVNVSGFFDSNGFYVAASRSLQESINLAYASLLIDYDSEVDKNFFVSSYLDSVNSSIVSFALETNYSLALDNVHDLELVVASLDRLREAEVILESAYESFLIGDLRSALFLSSTASERLFTASVWLETINHLSGNENFAFDVDKLAVLASNSLSDAGTSITYASTVVSSALIAGLERDLERVGDFFDEGKYARVIFESLSLKAEANLLMEVRGLSDDLLSSLFVTKRSNVVRLISREESYGEIPILAVSYFLYADYFFELGDFSNALRYLNYAAQYSSLSSSVFQAVTDSTVNSFDGFELVSSFNINSDDYGMFVLGLITASILFLIVLSLKRVSL